MEAIKIGIAGCGYIFQAVYAPVLEALGSRVYLSAFCDRNLETTRALKRRFCGARFYAEAESMLECEKMDAVIILMPERLNAPTAALALERGFPVYLEKPPGVTLAQLDVLEAKEEATGQTVFAAFNRRFSPLFGGWKPQGCPKQVRGVMSRVGRRIDNFPYTAAHLIDAAQYFSGSPLVEAETVFGGGKWRVHGKFENGAPCALVINPDGETHEETLLVETEGGSAIFDFPNPAATRYPLGRFLLKSRNSTKCESETIGSDTNLWHSMGFAGALANFLNALETGTLQASVHRLPICRPTIRTIESMLDAGGFGRP